MKRRHFTPLSLLVVLVLLVPSGVQPIEAKSQPPVPLALNQMQPDDARNLTFPSGGTWRNYTNGNYVNALAVEGDYVWAGTWGGVVRWDRTDGSYAKCTTTDGLPAPLERVCPGTPLYANPDLFRERFSQREGESRSVGLSLTREELTAQLTHVTRP